MYQHKKHATLRILNML